MDVSVLEREQLNNQYSNQYARRVGYTSIYPTQNVERQSVQNMTPNRIPSYQPQNYDYMNVQSDNIDMNINSYDLSQSVQQNAGYYSYYPYYNEQEYLNNVSANVETHPTNYYQPVQQNTYMDYGYAYAPQVGQVAPQDNGYEKVLPQKGKAKNKRTKALIAVYFMIVAICAALIIVNVVAASGATATAATVADSVYTSDAVYYTVDENGNVTEMAKTEHIVDYNYDTSTNWFDRMCDKIGNILG